MDAVGNSQKRAAEYARGQGVNGFSTYDLRVDTPSRPESFVKLIRRFLNWSFRNRIPSAAPAPLAAPALWAASWFGIDGRIQ